MALGLQWTVGMISKRIRRCKPCCRKSGVCQPLPGFSADAWYCAAEPGWHPCPWVPSFLVSTSCLPPSRPHPPPFPLVRKLMIGYLWMGFQPFFSFISSSVLFSALSSMSSLSSLRFFFLAKSLKFQVDVWIFLFRFTLVLCYILMKLIRNAFMWYNIMFYKFSFWNSPKHHWNLYIYIFIYIVSWTPGRICIWLSSYCWF